MVVWNVHVDEPSLVLGLHSFCSVVLYSSSLLAFLPVSISVSLPPTHALD
jgi:hypothetical protein